METQPYRSIRFEWLSAPDAQHLILSPDEGDIVQSVHSLPNGLGSSSYESINLSMGMSVFRAVNCPNADALGMSIAVAEIDVELKGPTFQAQTIRGGRVLEEQLYPEANLILSPGVDLFRYSERYRILPSIDGSSNSELTCLSLERCVLESLIGIPQAELLLEKLGLNPMPRVIAASIPLEISNHLQTSVSASLKGSAKKLHCQARVLDYLSALLAHTNSSVREQPSRGAKKRCHDLLEILNTTQGRIPTLDQLADTFGCSARTLNNEFMGEYGVSIYTYVTNQRLAEAHEAILKTNVALKVIAYNLGYAHVNHFITAFRKKFGYPPGVLRKKQVRRQSGKPKGHFGR